MSILPPLPLIDGCLFMDNSGWIEGMNTCYRSLQYKSMNFRISGAEKPSLNFGSCVHLGMEYRYANYGTGPVDDTFWEDITTLFTDFFAEHPAQSEDWRILNWAIEVFRKYIERYETESFNLLRYTNPIKCPYCNGSKHVYHEPVTGHSDGGTTPCFWCKGSGVRELMVELPFAHKFHTHVSDAVYNRLTPEQQADYNRQGGIIVMYSGRIDLPVSDDGIYVTDHKTTGMLGNQFWDQMRMTSQQRGYVWAFEQLTGMPVKGYVINAVRTKEPPQYVTAGKNSPKGKSQSPQSWWDESIVRDRYTVRPEEILQWKHNTTELIEEFFFHFGRGYMPQKTSWCTQYGRCSYFDVCNLDAADRGILLASGQFTDNKWSPLNKVQPTQAKQ